MPWLGKGPSTSLEGDFLTEPLRWLAEAFFASCDIHSGRQQKQNNLQINKTTHKTWINIENKKQQYTCFLGKGDGFLLQKQTMPGNRDTVVRACFYKKSPNQGILTKIRQFPGKVREAKWRHKFCLSNANLLFLFSHEINSCWRKLPKFDVVPIIYLLFPYFHGVNPL